MHRNTCSSADMGVGFQINAVANRDNCVVHLRSDEDKNAERS